MSTSKDYDIIIDLSVSQNANVFQRDIEQNLLQQNALEKLTKMIDELVEKAKEYRDKKKPDDCSSFYRSHNAITIDGVRGSGKTTFILNFLHLIPKLCEDGKIKGKIKNLEIIDPTLAEDREHIFLTIIGRIVEAVNQSWEGKRAKPNRTDCVDARYLAWQDCLFRLSRGLRSLSSENDWDGDHWADPQFIMEEGLQNAQQGEDLGRHFHRFVIESLRFIEKDAFIIALDDIDTNVKAGWPVMEVLRKYLTTPQIIVILSGDLELYTKLIFSQQCRLLGVEQDKILKKTKGYDEYNKVLHELTEQYMLKIMKPSKRIEIQTLKQITDNNKKLNIGIKYISSGNEKKENLDDFLKDFCNNIYGTKFQTNHLAGVLKEVPTRTCVQLLYTASEFKDAAEREVGDAKQRLAEAVEGLGHVFENALARAGIPIKHVYESEHIETLGALARTLAKQNLLQQGFHLFPSVEKAWQRQVMMVLGAAYARVLPLRPAHLFNYLVNMCLTAHLQGVIEKKDFDRYVEIAFEAEFETFNMIKRGMKFLLEKVNRDHMTQHCMIGVKNDCPESPEPQVISWHRYLLNIASVFAEPDGVMHRHISFYKLIGAIATIMWSVPSESRDDDKHYVADIIHRYGSEEIFNSISDEKSSEGSDEKSSEGSDEKSSEGSDEKSSEGSDEKSSEEFDKLFSKWCWSIEKSDTRPMPLLALTEAWNRFTFSIKDIDQNYDKKNGFKGIGNYLQFCIIILLNHLLECESIIMEYEWKDKLIDGNDIFARFSKNIEVYEVYNKHRDGKSCRIFDLFFSCPMWIHFFDLESNDIYKENIITKYMERLHSLVELADEEKKECQKQRTKKDKEECLKNLKAQKINKMYVCTTSVKSGDKGLNLFKILNELKAELFQKKDQNDEKTFNIRIDQREEKALNIRIIDGLVKS